MDLATRLTILFTFVVILFAVAFNVLDSDVVGFSVSFEPSDLDIIGAVAAQETDPPQILSFEYNSSLTEGQSQNFKAQVTDSGSGVSFVRADVIFNGDTQSYSLSENSGYYIYSYIPDAGNHNVTLVAQDMDGNTNQSKKSFTVSADSIAPVINSLNYTSDVEYGNTQEFVLDASDNVKVTRAQVILSSGTYNMVLSNGLYRYSFSPDLGNYEFQVKAFDYANHFDSVSGNFSVDSEYVINSIIINSTFDPNTTIINSLVNNSQLTNSVIIRSQIHDMLVTDADIQDNILNSGAFTYNGVNYSKFGVDLEKIYSGSGGCGDGVCSDDEDCSSCWQDCGICSGYSVSDRIDEDGVLVYTYDNVPDNYVAVIEANNEDFPFTYLKLNLYNGFSSGSVEIKSIYNNSISPRDYDYFSVNVYDISDTNIASGLLKFKVENEWFEDFNYKKESVVLKKYNGTDWVELGTSLESSDNVYTYYAVNIREFSDFLIYSAPTEAHCGNGILEDGETSITCCSDAGCSGANEVCVNNVCRYVSCGDGVCEYSENVANCPEDCGSCGDGVCSRNEDSESCLRDCKIAISAPVETARAQGESSDLTGSAIIESGLVCGDGICSPEINETEENCEADCKKTVNYNYILIAFIVVLFLVFLYFNLKTFKAKEAEKGAKPAKPVAPKYSVPERAVQMAAKVTPAASAIAPIDRYIRRCVFLGYTKTQIYELLKSAGWSYADITDAFRRNNL